jgi:hypothetical protein
VALSSYACLTVWVERNTWIVCSGESIDLSTFRGTLLHLETSIDIEYAHRQLSSLFSAQNSIDSYFESPEPKSPVLPTPTAVSTFFDRRGVWLASAAHTTFAHRDVTNNNVFKHPAAAGRSESATIATARIVARNSSF